MCESSVNRNPCIERSIEFAVKSSGLSGFSEVERRDWHWQCHCRHDRDSWPQIKQEQINFQRLHGVGIQPIPFVFHPKTQHTTWCPYSGQSEACGGWASESGGGSCSTSATPNLEPMLARISMSGRPGVFYLGN